jgi:hypothetical protein
VRPPLLVKDLVTFAVAHINILCTIGNQPYIGSKNALHLVKFRLQVIKSLFLCWH